LAMRVAASAWFMDTLYRLGLDNSPYKWSAFRGRVLE
jgi:hypothetical protein